MTLDDIPRPNHLQSGEGRQLKVITDLVTIKATAAETGGAYALFEVETPPAGGCPPHTQRYEHEAVFVIAGSYVFLIDGEQVELGPGGYAFVPRGTTHAYTNTGASAARMLVLVTPGGIHEQFFDDAGDHGDRPHWDLDMAKVFAVAPKYGIEFSLPIAENDCDTRLTELQER